MSLDISLNDHSKQVGTGVMVQENGQTIELTRQQLFEKFKIRIGAVESSTRRVFEYNLTHNLCEMAKQVSIGDHTLYQYLWRPDEIGVVLAKQMIDPLTLAVDVLRRDRSKLEGFNPPNGWGNFEHLLEGVELYLSASINNPETVIEASR